MVQQTLGKNEIVLLVSAKSNPGSVAGSIAKNLDEGMKVHLSAVGAGAVNQMIKAYGIARGYVAPSGKDLLLKGGFEDLIIDGEKRTGIKMTVVVN